MSVINPDDLPREGASIEDRTIFPVPRPVIVERRGRGGGAVAMITFLVMLVPLGLLGYFAYDLNQRLTAAELTAATATNDTIAELEATNESLRQQASNLEAQIQTFDTDVGRLLASGENKLQEIREMLSGAKRGWGELPEWAGETPDWRSEAEATLQTHVDRLEALRQQIRDWTPTRVAPPTAGDIVPGGISARQGDIRSNGGN